MSFTFSEDGINKFDLMNSNKVYPGGTPHYEVQQGPDNSSDCVCSSASDSGTSSQSCAKCDKWLQRSFEYLHPESK